jgi:hypothetical protein
MRYVVLAVAALALGVSVNMCSMIAAHAEDTPTDYRTVMKDCGQKWRASEERKAVEKGKGRDAWNTFRAKCVTESGYVAKRGKRS